MAKTFRELKVWQKAHEMVLKIYRATKLFPEEEKYGLTAQIRRSSASVPANIVEGHKRGSSKDFSRFLNLAEGSLEETKYHMLLARDLNYLKQSEYEKLSLDADEVGKMLSGFRRYIIS